MRNGRQAKCQNAGKNETGASQIRSKMHVRRHLHTLNLKAIFGGRLKHQIHLNVLIERLNEGQKWRPSSPTKQAVLD